MANHSDRWYFSKEQIRNSPSVQDGIEHAKELGYRQQCANLIQDIGQRLQVNQLVINTAIVYMHRFYMLHSFNAFHRNVMAACFLFLAAKVEEQPRKLEHVLKAAHVCLNKDEPQIEPKSDQYMQLTQELVNNESVLLQTLGFEVSVDHPNTFVVKCAQLVKASKELAQTAYFLATNSLHLTTFCIQYKPTLVACVCIYVSCLWANYMIPETSGKNWYEFIDNTATKKQLEDLSSYFIKILDSCPTRLKKRLTSGGAVVYKEGKVVAKKEAADTKDISAASNSEDNSSVSKPEVQKTSTSHNNINKLDSKSKAVPTKIHLTGLLKPHSHEATPPPSSRWSNSSHNHKKHHELKSSDLHRKQSMVQNHEHRKVNSTIDEKKAIHAKLKDGHGKPHQFKTPEQIKAERKKWTPEQWEEYKKRKEKEKLYYQKKKALENSEKERSSSGTASQKSDKSDGLFQSPQRIRKSSSSAHTDGPVKRQKLESDHAKRAFPERGLSLSSINSSTKDDKNKHSLNSDVQRSKSKERLFGFPDAHRSNLSSSGSDSDSSYKSEMHHRTNHFGIHNRLDNMKYNKNGMNRGNMKALPPPPPPPLFAGKDTSKPMAQPPGKSVNDYPSSKLNAPHHGSQQHLPPPPPPPVAPKFV